MSAMFDSQLLSLLHLCDSLFPTGSFAHSDGLETATSTGVISTSTDLRDWMDVCLEQNLGRFEAQAVWLALNAYIRDALDELQKLDAEVNALRPSSTARSASRAIGTRLLRTWTEVHGILRASGGGKVGPTYDGCSYSLPVAFGIVCGSIGIEPRAAVEAFIYTRLASICSSAMRLMSIGQREAHALLAATLERVPAVVDAIALRCERGERLGAFGPAIDIAVMGQQHVRSRLFLS
jgi:urease accessory protein